MKFYSNIYQPNKKNLTKASKLIKSGKVIAIPTETVYGLAGNAYRNDSVKKIYSLIHDDLPSMDNDDFRRGKESTHKKFGESTAILAGNSLLTIAFEILTSNHLNLDKEIKSDLVFALASCSGHLGIAGGQFLDLSFEGKAQDENCLLYTSPSPRD